MEIKKLEWLKTSGEMLLDIIHESYYSLHEFLLDSTEEDRKKAENELTDRDYKQYCQYLDVLKFENKDQLEKAICEYCEYVNQQQLGMGEMWDISDMAEDYAREKKLAFYED